MGTKSSHSPRAARRSSARKRASANRSRRPKPPAAPPAPPAPVHANGADTLKARAEAPVEVRRIPLARSFHDCPRCANAHDSLELKPLTRAPEGFSHFATCPNLGEPILLLVSGA